MMEYMILPDWGDQVGECKVMRWLKYEGELVKQGEPLVEIETAKINIEIEALCSGVVYEIFALEGEAVSAGTLLARIEKSNESFTKPKTPSQISPASNQPAFLRWLQRLEVRRS